MIQLIQRANSLSDKIAVKDQSIDYTYHDLLQKSLSIASRLLEEKQDLEEDRIALENMRMIVLKAICTIMKKAVLLIFHEVNQTHKNALSG